METIISFFSGSSLGYFVGNIFGGSQTGQAGFVGSIILNFGNWQFHLHHWLFFSLVLFIIFPFLKRKYNFSSLLSAFSVGLFGGLIFHGIFSYNDWHQILIKQ